MNITIERARPDDAAAILAYLNIVGRETDNLTFGAEGFPMSVEDEYRYLESMAQSSQSVMLVAKRGERIVGLASFSGIPGVRMSHRGSIAISVLKAEWGQGVGSRLMETVIRFARESAHAEIVSLEVRSDNVRAIHLYRKYGFEKIGVFRGFFKINGQYVDFDLMNLYL